MATHFKSADSNQEDSVRVMSDSPPVQDFGCFEKVASSFPDSSRQVDAPSPSTLDEGKVFVALDRICGSAAFRGSRRSQQFLRFVVTETLRGHADELKERTIATEVFGRGTDFEPGEDSLVRVKAHELRKRLDAYYESETDIFCRIEIPLGGYTPRFIVTPRPASAAPDQLAQALLATEINEAPSASRFWSRRRVLWSSAALLGCVAIGVDPIWQKLHAPVNPLNELWKPVFRTATPLVIFIPVLKDRTTQEVTDRIGIGPAEALRRVVDFLDARQYPYHLRFGSEMNFTLLKEQPSLLLGGFSSTWTELMTKGLRFTMKWDQQRQKRAIIDSTNGKSWISVNPTDNGYADVDYGLLSRIFDQETGQISMIAGGLTTFGTEAAAEILSSGPDLHQVLQTAPRNWQRMNFQVVVQTIIVGTTPSHPRIMAVHFW